MPQNDEVQFAGMASISEDRGAGQTLKWDSPFIATTYGLGFLKAAQYEQDIVFWPWTTINKVSKTSGSLQNGVQVKKKRSLLNGLLFILKKVSDEEKSEFKERKKEFKQALPQLHKIANKSNLVAEEQSIKNSQLKNESTFGFEFD